jgi:hypothetical protein
MRRSFRRLRLLCVLVVWFGLLPVKASAQGPTLPEQSVFTPGDVLTVSGTFTPSDEQYLIFKFQDGQQLRIRADVDQTSLHAMVPFHVDPATYGTSSGEAAVSYVRGNGPEMPLGSLTIQDVPASRGPLGAATVAALAKSHQELDIAIRWWEEIDAASQGRVSSTAMRADLRRIQDQLSALSAHIEDLQRSGGRLNVGSLPNGRPVYFDGDSLAALDRWLTAWGATPAASAAKTIRRNRGSAGSTTGQAQPLGPIVLLHPASAGVDAALTRAHESWEAGSTALAVTTALLIVTSPATAPSIALASAIVGAGAFLYTIVSGTNAAAEAAAVAGIANPDGTQEDIRTIQTWMDRQLGSYLADAYNDMFFGDKIALAAGAEEAVAREIGAVGSAITSFVDSRRKPDAPEKQLLSNADVVRRGMGDQTGTFSGTVGLQWVAGDGYCGHVEFDHLSADADAQLIVGRTIGNGTFTTRNVHRDTACATPSDYGPFTWRLAGVPVSNHHLTGRTLNEPGNWADPVLLLDVSIVAGALVGTISFTSASCFDDPRYCVAIGTVPLTLPKTGPCGTSTLDANCR